MYSQTFSKQTNYQNVLNIYGGSFVGDVNGDGYDDIICADKRYIYLMLNNGSDRDSIVFSKIDLEQDLSDRKVFKLWDVDGDGDLDILMGVSSKIVLIENTSTSEKTAFAKGKDFLFFGNQTKNLIHFDIGYLNSDTLYDIVVAYGRTEAFFQRENKSFYRFEITNAPFNDVKQVQMADLNNDNKTDIVLCGIDTTNHQGLLFLHNTVNNFSSSVLLSEYPTYKFIISEEYGNNPNQIAALIEDKEGVSFITYNHISSGDTLSFGENERIFLDKLPTAFAIGDFNKHGLVDMILAYEHPAPIQIWSDFTSNSSNTTSNLDSVGIVREVHVSDLNLDGNDDIVVFTDRNAFFIYKQIAKPVSTYDVRLDFKIAPNPTADFIRVDVEEQVDKFLIYDITGQMTAIYNGNQQKSLKLDIRHLKSGVYTIVPVVNNKVTIGKLFYKLY